MGAAEGRGWSHSQHAVAVGLGTRSAVLPAPGQPADLLVEDLTFPRDSGGDIHTLPTPEPPCGVATS